MKKWLFIPTFLAIFFAAAVLSYTDIVPFAFSPKIEIEKKQLDLEDPLKISFDRNVIQHKIESNFKITPNIIGNLSWSDKELIFTPVQPWEPGMKYTVSFQGMTSATSNFKFSDEFETIPAPQIQQENPQPDQTVDPEQAIKFSFDQGNKDYRLNFNIVPSIEYDLSIDQDRKNFVIKPKGPLQQNASYQVVASIGYQSQKDNKVWYQKEIANYIFHTSSAPTVEKIIPDNNDEDVTEYAPLKAYFNKPMATNVDWKNYLDISPEVQGNIVWEDDGKTMTFKPDQWLDDTVYNIKLKAGLPAQDNTFLEKDFASTFRSLSKKGIVQSKASTNNPKIKDGKYIDINLSKQLMTIFQDGRNKGNFRISSGKRALPTPTGMFSILNKRKRAWSREYKLFMPYWMAFTTKGHGIHELPEWPNGYKEGASHLGIPVSHGCVRLGVGAAATVYHWADIGTPVYVHY